MGDKFKNVGAFAVSAIVLGILIWWLGEVASNLGVAPTIVDKAVTLDKFQRSKDILLVVLPLATTSVGFWLGNQNTNKVQETADKEVQDAHDARDQAQKSEDGHRQALVEARDQAERARIDSLRAETERLLAEQRLAVVTAAYRGGGDQRDIIGPPDLGLRLVDVVGAIVAEQRGPGGEPSNAGPVEPHGA